MALTDAELLRSLLGESIPEGGTATDTLFSDDDISDLITRNGTVNSCLKEGWERKAAILSTLVDTIEGSSRRAMSDAHGHAMEMVRYYSGVDSPAAKTTIGRIKRQ